MHVTNLFISIDSIYEVQNWAYLYEHFVIIFIDWVKCIDNVFWWFKNLKKKKIANYGIDFFHIEGKIYMLE